MTEGLHREGREAPRAAPGKEEGRALESQGYPRSHPTLPEVEREGVPGLMLPRPWSPPIAKRPSQGCTHFPVAREEAKPTFPAGTDAV